ncbi:MAG: glutamate--cysteine ligase [Alphaproteobacteria bacterium]
MSGPSTIRGEPVTDRRQLVAHIEAGCKPKARWRLGTEHEKFAVNSDSHRRLPYEGPAGIRAMLEALTRFGWAPVKEKGNIIALSKAGASVTLEPGGQVELSGAPLATLFETCGEITEHLEQVKAVGKELGITFLSLGFDPESPRADVPWMPKGRYKIMRAYMPKRGTLGLDMMVRTCTVQVNLDFGSEADMVKKFRASLALQPIATALFANSPFTEGKPNGFQSYRSHVWTDTDPDRCGLIGFVFERGMSFERYVDYMLDVPMYFVYRDGTYIDASGQSFRDFLAGRLPALPGEHPTMTDWADHLTTAFPEVRMKQFLEMRGADTGPMRHLCALPALWVGLLYDETALDAALDLVKDWSGEERETLRRDTPRQGLHAPFRSRTVREVAVEMLKIARAGLKARARINSVGEDESVFLAPLETIAESGRTLSDQWLEAYATRWKGRVEPIYTESAY